MELLLVDDDQGFAHLLKMELEDQGNHVDMASNGLDGKSLGLKNHYDVIILDLMLPGMNGRLVCRELKKNKIGTPILIMSALDSQDEPFLFDDFYQKILLINKDIQETRDE